MSNLDRAEFVLAQDPKGMFDLTVDYPAQCERALAIAQGVSLSARGKISNVVLTGLGGSAAGGDFVRCLFEAYGTVPFSVNRDYHVGNFVGPETLVIASSYSGNTEETLSAYAEAKARGAQIIVVTSGGKLAENAVADGFPVIQIPAGQPPRTAMGYMFVPVAAACVPLGLLPAVDFPALFAHLRNCATKWGMEVSASQNPAKQLAQSLHGRVPILYGLGSYPLAAANRWKGQINENAKVMCFIHGFPELNHNEILGWVMADTQGVDGWSLVIMSDATESAKMQARARVTSELISHQTAIHTFEAPGSNLIERMMAMVYFGDFLSLYMAALNLVDPENIDWINVLKSELGKVS
jgi:glucose/mannose-6-phosphate isomerase